ncbi:hypothetical protein DVH24_010430 [Malus domestica]|uniref:Uncharacterized protein n=1 Tax=Malus domestica TaxID=3750 RepID=A0A498JSD6_MALDO|nr:hypothetical protein DVH24_010430 [Malus domestica]
MNKVKFPKLPQRKPALGELNEGLFGAYLLVDSEVALSWFPLQPIPPKVSTKIPNQNCSLTRHCCKLGLSLESSIRGRRYFLRSSISIKMVLQNDIDLLHPSAELEKRKHKIKRLVQTPNSFFMVWILIDGCLRFWVLYLFLFALILGFDVKCQGCFNM